MCVFSGLDSNVAILINNFKYRQPCLTAIWSLFLYFSQLAIKRVLHSFSIAIYNIHVYQLVQLQAFNSDSITTNLYCPVILHFSDLFPNTISAPIHCNWWFAPHLTFKIDSLSLDHLKYGTYHTTCNKTISKTHTHISYTLYFSLLRISLYEPLESCAFWRNKSKLSVLSSVEVLTRLPFLLQESRIGNEERQFVGEQQVFGLIAHGAGWRESVLLSVECLLHWQSSSPDKEQQ